MALSNTEFAAILDDESKRIYGDISWQEDEDHSPSVEFRAEVESDAGWSLFVRGSYNRLISALSYVLILKTEGRIYGLDLGKEHHKTRNAIKSVKHTNIGGRENSVTNRHLCPTILQLRHRTPLQSGVNSAIRPS